jgi:hypothetical protein
LPTRQVHAQIAADIRSQFRKKACDGVAARARRFLQTPYKRASEPMLKMRAICFSLQDLIKTVSLATSCRIFDVHMFAARRVLVQFEQFVTFTLALAGRRAGSNFARNV